MNRPIVPPVPTPVPSRNDPQNFAERADATLGALPAVVDGMNALGKYVEQRGAQADESATRAADSETKAAQSSKASDTARLAAEAAARSAAAAPAAPGTSTTKLTIGAGNHSLQTQAGKLWAPGQFVHIARTSQPVDFGMRGMVASYNATTGAMQVVVGAGMTEGKGSFTEWTITGSGPPATLAQLGLPNPEGGGDAVLALDAKGSAYVLRTVPSVLGFTPLRQGKGPGQAANPISIGWDGNGKLRLSVDNTDFGDSWPIDVRGRAAVADHADGAAHATRSGSASRADSAAGADYASNSGAVNGISGWSYSDQNLNPAYLWATQGRGDQQFLVKPSNLHVERANGAGWADRAGTSDNTGAFHGRGADFWLNNGNSAVRNVRNNGVVNLHCGIEGFGDVWWAVNISDEQLKKDIQPTAEDSLDKVSRIRFIQYRYRDDVTPLAIDDGRLHPIGLIAQQAEQIDPAWIAEGGSFKQPNAYALLMDALHAIQQLDAKVDALTSRLERLEQLGRLEGAQIG